MGVAPPTDFELKAWRMRRYMDSEDSGLSHARYSEITSFVAKQKAIAGSVTRGQAAEDVDR